MYQTIGWWGLAIIFSAIAAASLYVVTKMVNSIHSIVPLIIGETIFLSRFGIRVQVISWLLFAILLRICWTKENWQRWRYVSPFLIALWVNLHGSFPLGLLFFLIANVYYFDRKRVDWKSILLMTVTLLATFINPYGGVIWHEVWMQLSFLTVGSGINEWRPFWVRPELAFCAIFSFCALLGWRFRKSLSLLHVGIIGVSFYLTATALRHGPFFALSTIPFLSNLFQKFEQSITKIPFGRERYKRFSMIVIGLVLVIYSLEYFFSLKAVLSFRENVYYPKEAIQFVEKNKKEGHVFSSYEWGGYLIWKMPNEKVFVDGRMVTFRWDPPEGQSPSAFNDYDRILNGENVKELFEKYQISMVLWAKPQSKSSSTTNFIQKLFGKPSSKSFLEILKNLGWKEIYSDAVAVVYIKYEEE